MSSQRIVGRHLETGELITPDFGKSLQSSLVNVGSGWSDFLKVEQHSIPPIEAPPILITEHTLSLHLGHPVRVEQQLAGEPWFNRVVRAGNLHIFSQGVSLRSRWHDNIDFLVLSFNSAFITRVVQDLVNPDQVEFTNPQAFQDKPLEYLCRAVKAELEAGCSGGRLFGESLATALIVQMLQKYSVHVPKRREYSSGLGQQKLEAAIAYIQDHLATDLPLSAIATHLGMSQYYFCRLFKQSMGITPHQYLIQQRVKRAKELLAHHQLSLTDVAALVGFSNQSHFTTQFRKLTGTTPRNYQGSF